ncbi:tetratricopeptide repeat protein [Streptomyces asoensis]|uniref:Tetratricopeptide repeat protein n=1 Tax=Streptomyces asoensis TaxID=249586 RepID=A0A6M4WF24_9ACTN|nr:tetratricopeptide repeat protein [Streptomyces asoensis]
MYERASDRHRRGRPEEAVPLLQELLRQEPEHVAARYAYGICLTDTGRHGEAQVQFRRLLDGDPRHYEAAYRLGRLLQADADPQGAAEAYRKVLEAARQVLGVAEFRDTAARLRACQDTPGTTVPVSPPAPAGLPVTGRPITPGPPTLRAQSDTHRVADRGAPGKKVRLMPRHLIPAMVGKAFLAVVAALAAAQVLVANEVALLLLAITFFLLPWVVSLLVGAAAVVGTLTGVLGGESLLEYLSFVPMTVVLTVAAGVPVALVRSRTWSADFYEYGVDVKSGFIRRKVQFVWYYQIVESPSYVRTFGTYFTNTASLGLRYNEAGAYSTAYVELPGIGTPNQVKEIGRYVESRIFPERYDVRKFVT